jgi:hypothetical protein
VANVFWHKRHKRTSKFFYVSGIHVENSLGSVIRRRGNQDATPFEEASHERIVIPLKWWCVTDSIKREHRPSTTFNHISITVKDNVGISKSVPELKCLVPVMWSEGKRDGVSVPNEPICKK